VAVGPLAQLVAHLHDAQGVTGSSPVRPTRDYVSQTIDWQSGERVVWESFGDTPQYESPSPRQSDLNLCCNGGMPLYTSILLAVSTVASCLAAITAFSTLGQANEASYRQYQAQELADYSERRRRVERVADLVEDIYIPNSQLRTSMVEKSRLLHALVGLHEILPNCVKIAYSDIRSLAYYDPAQREIQLALSKYEGACDLVRARRYKKGWISRRLSQSKAQIPYPKHTAP
jgi:hypothetical protein